MTLCSGKTQGHNPGNTFSLATTHLGTQPGCSGAGGDTVGQHPTYPSGHTAEVYQEKRYWQSAVSWLNSGIPSFTRGSQWKKMVEDTDFVLSFPHLEDEVNTTSRSPSVKKAGTHTGTAPLTRVPQQRAKFTSPSSVKGLQRLKIRRRVLHLMSQMRSSGSSHSIWRPRPKSGSGRDLNLALRQVWPLSSANNMMWSGGCPRLSPPGHWG